MDKKDSKTEYTYQNKNNLFVWTITTIIIIAMIVGGIFYFIFPFFYFINNHETIFFASYITMAPLVVGLLYLMVSYYISMLQTGNKLDEYKINREGFQFKHHLGGDQYKEGFLSFDQVERCIISRQIVEVRKPPIKDRFLVYPVIHLIYKESSTQSHILLKHNDYSKEAMNCLLQTLFDRHIPIEFTERQIYLVPEDDLLEMFVSKVKTRNLPFKGDILEHQEFNGYTSEKPAPEMGPSYRSNVVNQGVYRFHFPIWLLFIGQFLVYLGIFGYAELGKADADSMVLSNLIPYVCILISYVLFFYRIMKAKYWKSIFHWFYSETAIVFAYLIVEQFYSNNYTTVLLEELSFINVGFHLASAIPYFITVIMIRSRWPAFYHEETKIAMENID